MTAIEDDVSFKEYKNIKKILKIGFIALCSISILLGLFVISLQYGPIQTFLTKKIASYLSAELDSDISLDRIYIKPLSFLQIVNFSMKDRNGDTLIAAEQLYSDFSLTQFFHNRIQIDKIKLKKAQINFEVYKDSSNFTKLVNYFGSKKQDSDPKRKKIDLDLRKIELTDCQFSFVNHNNKHRNQGVDFSNLRITDLSGIFDNISLDTIVRADIRKLTLKEKSGLHLQELSTKAVYAEQHMEFKDLHLLTNKSTVQDYLKLEYDSMKDFNDFMRKVKITGNLRDSYVDSKDIELFAPAMRNVIFETHIKKAKVKGTVANIQARDVHFTTAKQTELSGNFTIKGLPDINKTIFDFDLEQLRTSPADVEVLVPKFANKKNFVLPKELHRLERVNFQGKFKGLYNDFAVDGYFQTALGSLQNKSQIKIGKILQYSGSAQSSSLDIGKLLAMKNIGTTGFDVSFDGQGLLLRDLDIQLKGSLHNSHIQNYTYRQIAFDGGIRKEVFDLVGQIEDPNLRVTYSTNVDWAEGSPKYLLDADIAYAQLNALHFLQKDSITLSKAKINTNLIGSGINNITGYLHADSIQMITSKGVFNIDHINFTADGDQERRSLYLQSDIVDAKMYGKIDLYTIGSYFRSLAMRYAPAIGIEIKPYNPQNFDLEINVKNFSPIATLFDPTLAMDKGSYLKAAFSTENYTANFLAFSPNISYKGVHASNFAVQENADDKEFTLDINADRLNLGDSLYIKNISIRNALAHDSLRFNIILSESNATNYLDLKGNIHFAHNAPAYIQFDPSTIIINRENWLLNDDATMRISKGKIYLSNLILSQTKQKVRLDGIISNDNDKLHIDFEQFGLSSLNGITNPIGINLTGSLNGKMEISSILKKPFASVNISTSPITYNQTAIGQLKLIADFDPSTGLANIDLDLADEQKRGLKLAGHYNFFNDNEKLQVEGKLNETDLTIFQPFLRNLISNLKGKGNGDIAIKGSFRNPKISGLARIQNAEFTVNYLKTHYRMDNQSALVDNNAIILQNLTIKDTKGQSAIANGIINLSKLASPYIDIDVTGDNVMILNTTYKDNNLYYGKAFASGTFRFKGYTSAIDIDINARSEAQTAITIPFNSAMTVSDSDFIYFISKDSTENKKQERKSLFKGLTMNMNIEVTPDAEINLPTTLGTLKGNGKGELSMKISSLGDFEMFGDYIVSSGKFHFTAQDFINKYFDIKEGGTIRWTGNPSEAVINLNAIYQQRTAIGPLYNAAGRAGEDERVLAQADMLIKGTLEQPDITFDLNFPQNPYIKDQLQSFLSDANNVNQQALSLIIRRSFTPSSTNEIGREVNNTLLSAGTEIAFNQLNNIITQSLNINFFDLNIRSFNDASASVRLLNDRLTLTGGITDRTNYLATDLTFFRAGVTTDAELTYRLRKDGNLMLRAYNRPYTRNFLIRVNDAEYISALGLVYRQEFNTIREFWQKIIFWNWSKKSDPIKP